MARGGNSRVPHWWRQGKPLLAISREAPPSIQNTGRLLKRRIPNGATARQLPLPVSRTPAVPQTGLGAPGDPLGEDWGWVEFQQLSSAAQGETPGSCTGGRESLYLPLVERPHSSIQNDRRPRKRRILGRAAVSQPPLDSQTPDVPQTGQGAPGDHLGEDWGWVEFQQPGSMAREES